jgi:hypothetical protein
VKRLQKASAKSPRLVRALPTDPRYELVFEEPAAEHSGLSTLLLELKSLSERGGAAIGNAYALAASSLLKGKERLEDQNAERRFRQRSESGRPARPSKALAPSKVSV